MEALEVPIEKKLIVVGDGECGKTALLIVFAKEEFFKECIPTIFDNYDTYLEIDGFPIQLTLIDTPGVEDWSGLRPLQYPGVDVVLICFSVMSSNSFFNVRTRWYPEVRHFCRNVPIFLIGTKNDLRDDKCTIEKMKKYGNRMVDEQEAQDMAKKIGAVAYIECSSLTRFNIDKVFKLAAQSTLQERKHTNGRCRLL